MGYLPLECVCTPHSELGNLAPTPPGVEEQITGRLDQLQGGVPCDVQCRDWRHVFCGFTYNNWLVVLTPLKNMKVSWHDYSQYMEKR